MKTKTDMRAGEAGFGKQDETIVCHRDGDAKMKMDMKARRIRDNHNESMARDRSRGIGVKTNVKANGVWQNHNETLVQHHD